MRLSQFKYLIALEKYSTFSKAAQVLFVSQPSLSAAVKELEEELGFEILHRSKRGVSFTVPGQAVLQEAKVIMEAVQRIEHIEYQEDNDLKGKLRIGGIPYFCDMLLVNTLMDLQQKYPELLIQLIEDDTDYIVKLIAEEQLDLGIVMVSYINEHDAYHELNRIRFQYHELFEDEMVFVAKEEHPLFMEENLSLEQILHYPFITHLKSGSPVTEKLLQDYGNPHKMRHVSGFHNLKQYILRSDAISAFPRTVVGKMMGPGEKLRIVEVEDFTWCCKVGWISKKETLGTAEEIFVEALHKQCKIVEQSINQKSELT